MKQAPRSVSEQVEQQAKRWARVQQSRASGFRPCVAISRLPGSGGSELGQRVADRLDYGLFGVEILDEIAREQRIQRQLLEGVDERVRNVVDRYVAAAFHPGAFTEGQYLRHVVRVVTTLGERGRAVILGRGAPFILPPRRALRVRAVAPRGARAERVATREGVSGEEAARILARRDAERSEFLRHHFQVDPDDDTLYDLVVNTATLGIDAAAAVVVAALERRFGT